MAIDPRISLAADAGDLSNVIPSALQTFRLAQQATQQAEQAPLQNRLLEAQVAQAEAAQPTALEQFDVGQQNRLRSIATFAQGIIPQIESGDLSGAKTALESRFRALDEQGINTEDTVEAIGTFNRDPQAFLEDARGAVNLAREQGLIRDPSRDLTAQQREFAGLTEGFTPEETEQARRIRLGLDPRAVGSAAQTLAAQPAQVVETVAETQAKIEGAKTGAKEEAKLIKRFKLEPQVESAVTQAVASAKNTIEKQGEARSNNTALQVYDTAMGGLVEALGGTTTGPVAGFLPAVTTNQQIAQGAIAAMAPVLKQMFRGAGEGTFTDKDQELLLQMVPTRRDTPGARESKIRNIDAIVRAKLGQTPVQQEQAPQTAPVQEEPHARQDGQIMIDANGNRAMVFPDGTFEEL